MRNESVWTQLEYLINTERQPGVVFFFYFFGHRKRLDTNLFPNFDVNWEEEEEER